MTVQQIEVTEQMASLRLDKALAMTDNGWSRTQISTWLTEGRITREGDVPKANYKVKAGEVYTVDVPEEEVFEIIPQDLALTIIYEDDDVAVVYKPRGMVVHPAPGHMKDTLVNGLAYQLNTLSDMNGELRPGIVHRIDKDTSGLLMVAKTNEAHEGLVQQLVDKTVTRKYLALVHGHIAHDKGTIDAPIGRDTRDRQKQAVQDNGKHAVTHFTVVERLGDFTLVECRLETGRTHQIRVHMDYIGYPLAGDPKYGPKKTIDFGGQVLHAGVIGFVHPITKKYLQFEQPLPSDFTDLLAQLRK
ncbi:MAG TPA: RluA family pseudouridine synthase [Metalysinibacillus jejuensis]|uniref:Pseudouridine synthase n=1 Tax=Metalysinibacillus jejuensis TaxID=914327 RepID=A0A921NAQ3_9BACL|nr:RluA family pseudouridine synthase [Metalysinibacillus jejuensis]HJH10636.1 RluA family pseudouridine synthase [Metalysinibacillus jejuensis]